MKVVYTDDASEDLDGILAYITANWSTVYEPF
jgi:plasmid stabilization system protein ParE